MLNRIETRIMDYVFTRCRGKRTVLMPPGEILENIRKGAGAKSKFDITQKQLEIHMKNIVLDGYVDFSLTDNKGVMMYVITLSTRGEAFRRERDERRKRRLIDAAWKIFLAILGVTVGFFLRWLL